MTTDCLLDTGICIRHLRGREAVRDHLVWLSDQGQVWMSVLTRTELLRGMRDHERQRTMILLTTIPCLPVDESIAALAGDLMRARGQSGFILNIVDAIIAATAIRYDLVLATYNTRDFRLQDLTLLDLP